ncbi:4Fe-4S binding protein [Desulforhopalus singaporensis]|nr:4Fe-4S binding protein [Desulforhopalus singaporensis]
MELVPGMMIIGLLLLLFGRFYCSWICSASSVHQLAEPVLYRPIVGRRVPWLKRFFLTPCEGVSKKLNLGYGDGLAIFLGLVAGVALFDFPFFTIFSPMGLVSRNVIELAVHKRLRYDLLLLAGPLLVGLFFRHGWKTCCPDGLMQRFVASWNKTLLPEVDPTACNGCAKCRRTCPAGLLAEDTVRLAGDCLKCLQCIEICPNHAVHLRLFPRKTRTPIPSKLSPGRRV